MTADQDINATRLRSRQDYLAKREAEQLALLRRQVEEEADEEERLGDRLSKQERADFRKNRETLRLAEARNAIDEHRDGYILPDADYSNRSEVLTRKHKERGYEKSEVQLWEEEQTKKVGAQVKRPERTNEEDYEFVFDESQNIKFETKPTKATTLDPEQRRLLTMLDEAETKAKTIQDTRKSLPIYVYKEQLKEAIRDNQVLVVVAETGSGRRPS